MHFNGAYPVEVPSGVWMKAIADATTDIQRKITVKMAFRSMLRQNLLPMIDKAADEIIAEQGTEQLWQEMSNNPANLTVQAAIRILGSANQSQREGTQHTRSASTIVAPEQNPASKQVKTPDPTFSTDASSWLLEPPTGQFYANINTVPAESRSFDAPYGNQDKNEASSSMSVAMPATPGVNVDTSAKWWEGLEWADKAWYQVSADETNFGCLLCGKVALTQHLETSTHQRLEAKAIAGGGWERKELPASFEPHPDPRYKR